MIAFIPVKSTSRRIPRKNFQDLGGKPLYQWTVDFALSMDNLSQVVICCDDMDHVQHLDLDDARLKLIGRPEWTSDPMVSNLELIKWWVDAYDLWQSDICLLQPTQPFRNADDFHIGLESYRGSGQLTMLVEAIDELLVNPSGSLMQKGCSRVLGDCYFFNPDRISFNKNFILQGPQFIEVPFSYMHLNIDTWVDLNFARNVVSRFSSPK